MTVAQDRLSRAVSQYRVHLAKLLAILDLCTQTGEPTAANLSMVARDLDDAIWLANQTGADVTPLAIKVCNETISKAARKTLARKPRS